MLNQWMTFLSFWRRCKCSFGTFVDEPVTMAPLCGGFPNPMKLIIWFILVSTDVSQLKWFRQVQFNSKVLEFSLLQEGGWSLSHPWCLLVIGVIVGESWWELVIVGSIKVHLVTAAAAVVDLSEIVQSRLSRLIPRHEGIFSHVSLCSKHLRSEASQH